MILKGCTFFNEEFEKEYGDIVIENGKIAEIGLTAEYGKDMSGMLVLPGFVDIHTHGGGGGDTCDSTPEALNSFSRYLASCGVTSFCPTTMTLPVERLCDIVKTVSIVKNDGAKILGVNLEGPFVSVNRCGAQNKEFIAKGTKSDFEKLYSASNGTVKLITIAPEAFESSELIGYASEYCTVSVGHSDANSEQFKKALDDGARHVTHLFNAMPPLHHREGGIIAAALNDSRVTCELICDGKHICPDVLKLAFNALGEDRGVVISDAMRAAGLGNGEYEFGGQRVFVNDGVARLADSTIAASVTNMLDEFRLLVEIGVDFKTALKSCTINPARVVGEDANIGSIAKGKCADLIVLNEKLELQEVYIDGTLA